MKPQPKAILEYIRRYKGDTGNAPTVREIAAACSVSSTSEVNRYLGYLEEMGQIKRTPGVARGIQIPDELEYWRNRALQAEARLAQMDGPK